MEQVADHLVVGCIIVGCGDHAVDTTVEASMGRSDGGGLPHCPYQVRLPLHRSMLLYHRQQHLLHAPHQRRLVLEHRIAPVRLQDHIVLRRVTRHLQCEAGISVAVH